MTPASCVPVRLRPDITAKRIKLGRNADWVIRDPLSRNLFYFSEAEYCILRMLDGKRSWIELAADVSRRLMPEFIDVDALVRFVADASSKGLVESIDPNNINQRRQAPRDGHHGPAWWHQPLAIRLPGFYPDQYLQRIFDRFAWMQKIGVSVKMIVETVILIWLIAVAVTTSHWDSLVIDSSLLASSPPPHSILLFCVCIGITKILHELGHAIACKIFGGECREIGLMFLMGIPCLYCDVSDAWMMPSRWKRVFVSAAGMIVEVTLASVAVIGWVFMAPGPWRDAALMIAIVGSVNTVLINGNPLLRYDGYFIFSDLVRIPNLGYEAIETLRHVARKIVWGRERIEGEVAAQQAPAASTWFLIGYALASAVYRYAMLLAIIYAIYRYTSGQGMAWVAVAVGGLILGRNQYHWWKSIVRSPRGKVNSMGSRVRWITVRVVLTVFFAGVWFTPFSRTISVPFVIRPAKQQEMYAAVPGRIEFAVDAGQAVRQGELVLTLANESLSRESMSLATERRQLVAKTQALKLQQSVRRNAAEEILALESAIESLDQRFRWHQEQIERLSIRAPADGTVYSPLHKPKTQTDAMSAEASEDWTGAPLSVENVGAWIDVGTLVAIIGDARKREAVLMVGQSHIQWVRPEQEVELLRNDFDAKQRRGIVRDVSLMSATEESVGMPHLWDRTIQAPRDSTDRVYRVLVEMTDEEDSELIATRELAIPVRSTGMAKITVEPMSLHQRTCHLLREMFSAP